MLKKILKFPLTTCQKVIEWRQKKKSISLLSERFGGNVMNMNDYEIHALLHISRTLDRLEDKLDIIYDIGSNDGLWSEIFALYTGNNVYAFEPLPKMIQLIQMRSKRIPLIKIQPVACGATWSHTNINEDNFAPSSSILKMTDLHTEEWSFTGKSSALAVNVTPLDDWRIKNYLPFPSLIKIDVQGYENEVLTGASETLKKTKYLWIELNLKNFYENGSSFDSVYKKVTGLGFELVDVVDLIRSRKNNQLMYMDGIFKKCGQ